MEQQLSNLDRVMETEDHFKNGASPKSQMSRGNVKNKMSMKYFLAMLTAWVALSVSVSSCSNDDNSDNNNQTTSVFTSIELNIHRDMPFINSDEVRVKVIIERGEQVITQAALSTNPCLVKLTFKDVSDEYLYSIESVFNSRYAAAWPQWALSISTNTIEELNVSNRGTRIAIASVCSYYQGNGPTNYFRDDENDVGFIYSNTDCDITGVTVPSSAPRTHYDIHLKKGWNMIVRQRIYQTNQPTEYRVLTKLIKEGTWTYRIG